MTLKEAINAIRCGATEIDIKVCYNNEYDEECTLCRTFVEEDSFKEDKDYWSSKVRKFSNMMDTSELERYEDFKVDFMNAKGKNHFFIFAHNFH